MPNGCTNRRAHRANPGSFTSVRMFGDATAAQQFLISDVEDKLTPLFDVCHTPLEIPLSPGKLATK